MERRRRAERRYVSPSLRVGEIGWLIFAGGSAGGVKLVGAANRITLDNTLDERLRLLEASVRPLPLPFLRTCADGLRSCRCCLRSGMISSGRTRTASSTHEGLMLALVGRMDWGGTMYVRTYVRRMYARAECGARARAQAGQSKFSLKA